MKLPFFIAWRYLFTRQREPLEWFTTAVSLLGVAIGVGTMISVCGVMDGLRHKAIEEMLSWMPQIEISNPAWDTADPDPKVLARIKADPEVAQAEALLSVWCWITLGSGKDRYRNGVEIYGVDRLAEGNILGVHPRNGIAKTIAPGEILVADGLTSRPLIGKDVVVTSRERLKHAMYPVFPSAHFTVSSTFGGLDSEFGSRRAFIHTSALRRLAIKPYGIDSIHVKLHNPMKADEVTARLKGAMPAGTHMRSWTQRLERMFVQMRFLKGGMLLVMLMTIVVAALNIIGTLTLIIIQKTSEIGIMKAIGAPDRMVARIFMFEGLIVGWIGAILGAGMGLGFLQIVQQFKIKMPGEVFDLKTIPVEIHVWTIVAMMIGAIVICTLAATLPARHAAKMRPVAALRC